MTDSSSEPVEPADARRAFGGVVRALGQPAFDRLSKAHVLIAGIGGVGSWAVEGLARSGVGRLTLIDMDHVAASNINRQLHALNSTVGASKIEVMQRRIRDINPACRVHLVDEFVTGSNVATLVPEEVDVVIDAVDQAPVKAAIAALTHARGQALVMCGAAGARTDPLALRQADLARTTGDPLLARVRSLLRRDYGFERGTDRLFGVAAIYSVQPPQGPPLVGQSTQNSGDLPTSALACAGYGSLVTVTSVMGMAAAAATIAVIDSGQGVVASSVIGKRKAESGATSGQAIKKIKRDKPVQQLEKT